MEYDSTRSDEDYSELASHMPNHYQRNKSIETMQALSSKSLKYLIDVLDKYG